MGIDLDAEVGTPVYAVQSGTAIRAGKNSGGYGNVIVIEHPSGLMSFYAHLSKLLVRRKDRISKGQKIAHCGKSGRATGSHLHFEIRAKKGTVALDPVELYPNLRPKINRDYDPKD